MHTAASIRRINQMFRGQTIDLPERPGVYAFWWVASKAQLMAANRHLVLNGPNQQSVGVEYGDWWPPELQYPCLYAGKSTNIRKRFAQHLRQGSAGRLRQAQPRQVEPKPKPSITSCQLRLGIEQIFPEEPDPLALIFRSVGFSYRVDFPENPIAERFFEESRLVGIWRPWFNIEAERCEIAHGQTVSMLTRFN